MTWAGMTWDGMTWAGMIGRLAGMQTALLLQWFFSGVGKALGHTNPLLCSRRLVNHLHLASPQIGPWFEYVNGRPSLRQSMPVARGAESLRERSRE